MKDIFKPRIFLKEKKNGKNCEKVIFFNTFCYDPNINMGLYYSLKKSVDKKIPLYVIIDPYQKIYSKNQYDFYLETILNYIKKIFSFELSIIIMNHISHKKIKKLFNNSYTIIELNFLNDKVIDDDLLENCYKYTVFDNMTIGGYKNIEINKEFILNQFNLSLNDFDRTETKLDENNKAYKDFQEEPTIEYKKIKLQIMEKSIPIILLKNNQDYFSNKDSELYENLNDLLKISEQHISKEIRQFKNNFIKLLEYEAEEQLSSSQDFWLECTNFNPFDINLNKYNYWIYFGRWSSLKFCQNINKKLTPLLCEWIQIFDNSLRSVFENGMNLIDCLEDEIYLPLENSSKVIVTDTSDSILKKKIHRNNDPVFIFDIKDKFLDIAFAKSNSIIFNSIQKELIHTGSIRTNLIPLWIFGLFEICDDSKSASYYIFYLLKIFSMTPDDPILIKQIHNILIKIETKEKLTSIKHITNRLQFDNKIIKYFSKLHINKFNILTSNVYDFIPKISVSDKLSSSQIEFINNNKFDPRGMAYLFLNYWIFKLLEYYVSDPDILQYTTVIQRQGSEFCSILKNANKYIYGNMTNSSPDYFKNLMYKIIKN